MGRIAILVRCTSLAFSWYRPAVARIEACVRVIMRYVR